MSPPAFNLTALDHQLLAMTDEEFVAHDWDDLQSIIGESHGILSPHNLLPLISCNSPPLTKPD